MVFVPMALALATVIGGCATTQRQEPPAPIIDARRAPAPTASVASNSTPSPPPEPTRVYAYQPVTGAEPGSPGATGPDGAAAAQMDTAATARADVASGAVSPSADVPRQSPGTSLGDPPTQLQTESTAGSTGETPAAVAPGDTTPALPAPETQLASASALQAPQLAPAVDALAQQAERQRQGSDYAGAAATLERALRLQSREAYLWNRLAHVRLEQGLASQAANLAARANALSGDSESLKRDNWRVIADARRRTGDLEGAQEAQRKATGS